MTTIENLNKCIKMNVKEILKDLSNTLGNSQSKCFNIPTDPKEYYKFMKTVLNYRPFDHSATVTRNISAMPFSVFDYYLKDMLITPCTDGYITINYSPTVESFTLTYNYLEEEIPSGNKPEIVPKPQENKIDGKQKFVIYVKAYPAFKSDATKICKRTITETSRERAEKSALYYVQYDNVKNGYNKFEVLDEKELEQ